MKLAVSMAIWLSVMNTAIAGDTTAATVGTPSAGNTLLQGVKQMLSSERQGIKQMFSSQQQMMTAQHNGIKQMLTSKKQTVPSSYSMGASGPSVELLAIRNKLIALESKLEASEAKLQATQTKLQATQTKLKANLEATQSNQKAMQTKLEAKLQATEAKLQAAQTKLQATQSNQKAMQTRLEGQLEAAKAKQDATEAALKVLESNRKGGSTFVRWGRKTCSNTSRLVYSGVAGGSWYGHSGAASNPLCLTMKPQFDSTPVPRYHSFLYGAEYQHIPNHHDQDVPCSVCRAPQSTTILIPATRDCPKGWTIQYTGHLTAGYYNSKAASQFVCLDKNPENVNSGTGNKDGYLFHYTITRCGSLPCPPYANKQVVLCAICSK